MSPSHFQYVSKIPVAIFSLTLIIDFYLLVDFRLLDYCIGLVFEYQNFAKRC